MILLLYVFILLLPVLLGHSIILCAGRNKNLPIPFIFAISFGLGTGAITQWMLWLGILKIPFSIYSINTPLILLTATLYFVNFQSKPFPSQIKLKKNSSFKNSKFLIALFLSYITLMYGYIFWDATNLPVFTWDAFSLNVFKAKIFYVERSLKYLSSMPHYSYPLHVPFLQAWLGISLGFWDEQIIKIFFPLYSLSILLIQYYFLKEYVSKHWALLGGVFLLSSNFFFFHSKIAYRDLTLLYFNYTTIMLLLLWNKNKNIPFLFLIALLSGFTSFVKLEGTGYVLIHTLFLMSLLLRANIKPFAQKIKYFFVFCIPSYLITATYHGYKILFLKKSHDPTKMGFDLYNLNILFSQKLIEKAIIVTRHIFDNLFYTNNWNILWFILAISLINAFIDKKIFRCEIQHLVITIILILSMYGAAYTLTQHFYWATQTNTVLSRGLLQLLPFVTTLIILINFQREKID